MLSTATYNHAKVPQWTNSVRCAPAHGMGSGEHGAGQARGSAGARGSGGRAGDAGSCLQYASDSTHAALARPQVIEHAMKRLKDRKEAFKYIVTCVIMQKNGAGMHMATSCHWDNSSDGERYRA